MDPLDLEIENRVFIDLPTEIFVEVFGKRVFCRLLCFGKSIQKRGIFGERFQFFQLRKIGDPTVADFLGNQFRKVRIGFQQPPSLCNAVGLVVEFIRIKFRKIGNQSAFQQLGMKRGDAVD